MDVLFDWLRSPWPWYVAGPIIGLMVPLMLFIGNRSFGSSSNLRHLCSIAQPPEVNVDFFKYDWKEHYWSMVFVAGTALGGYLAGVAFPNPDPVALSAAALEALQLFGSFSRNCGQCQQRTVVVKKSNRTQYHHQIVKAQLVGVEPAFGLDAELIAPTEGEGTAARRLIRRIIEQYPFVRVFTLDALYLVAPILKMIHRSGRAAIVPLKDKTRDIYKDAQSLFASMAPQNGFLDGEPIRYWDIAGFTSMPGLRDVPVRVVRTLRTFRIRRRDMNAALLVPGAEIRRQTKPRGDGCGLHGDPPHGDYRDGAPAA